MNKQHERLKRREFLTKATQTAAVAFTGGPNLLAAMERNASPASISTQKKPLIQIGIHFAAERWKLGWMRSRPQALTVCN